MNALDNVDRIIFEKLVDLPIEKKQEVLTFIEYLRIRQDQTFIDYVNKRSSLAAKSLLCKSKLTSLQELQAEYEKNI